MLQKKEKELKSRQEKLRKVKKSKETKLGESRTHLAVIAQSLLELQQDWLLLRYQKQDNKAHPVNFKGSICSFVITWDTTFFTLVCRSVLHCISEYMWCRYNLSLYTMEPLSTKSLGPHCSVSVIRNLCYQVLLLIYIQINTRGMNIITCYQEFCGNRVCVKGFHFGKEFSGGFYFCGWFHNCEFEIPQKYFLSRRVYYKPFEITKLTVSKLLSLENDPNGENLTLRKHFTVHLHPRCCWPTLTMESQRDIMVSAMQSQGCHFSGTLSQFVLYKRIAIYQLSGNFTPL